MGNILNDIVEEVNIKPNKSKLIIKWIISIAGSLIIVAFAFGQFKSSFFNRLDKLETTVNETKVSVEILKTDVNTGFNMMDAKIDKVYDDGLTLFNETQVYNNKQLGLIIDYGSSNKDLLKRMLELNTMERTKAVENQVEQAKKEPVVAAKQPEFSIAVKPIVPEKKTKDYISIVYFIEVENNDTIFGITGATIDYMNKIDTNKYKMGAVVENPDNPKLYDFSYRKK